MRGPWSVGVRTVEIGRLTVEVLYPAVPGSEEGIEPLDVDIRCALPESERSKVTDDVRPIPSCDCYSDLPLDDAHGPYPLILFVHGTASWRTQSLSLMEHWASRGFVVYPQIILVFASDILAGVCGLPPVAAKTRLDGETVLPVLQGMTVWICPRMDRLRSGGRHRAQCGGTATAYELQVKVVASMVGSVIRPPDLTRPYFWGECRIRWWPSARRKPLMSERNRHDGSWVSMMGPPHLFDICELTNTKDRIWSRSRLKRRVWNSVRIVSV